MTRTQQKRAVAEARAHTVRPNTQAPAESGPTPQPSKLALHSDDDPRNLPMSPHVLDKFLSAFRVPRGGESGPAAGVRNGIREVVFKCRSECYVLDRGAINPAEKLTVAMPCTVIHPGLSIHEDSSVYGGALSLARRLESFFGKSMIGSFWQPHFFLPGEEEFLAYLAFHPFAPSDLFRSAGRLMFSDMMILL